MDRHDLDVVYVGLIHNIASMTYDRGARSERQYRSWARRRAGLLIQAFFRQAGALA